MNDPVLGFFHRWVEEFAKHAESIVVVCLKEGEHHLPQNVRVLSLGKEGGVSRLKYITRFYRYIWRERKNYDAVFVHMNQEYILLGGIIWRIFRKRVYMWRNHYAGSSLTDIAAAFCTKVFCTSKHSYTAKYAKTAFMPVGVDTTRFFADASVAHKQGSVLFLARMSPSKRPEMLLQALSTLKLQDVAFIATLVGSPLPQDEVWYEQLKASAQELGISDSVSFRPGVPNAQTPALYQAHEIFVNTSRSGMFDKTLFEAAACGCRVLAASKDFAELAGDASYFDSAETLATRLVDALHTPFANGQNSFVVEHTLARLGERLTTAMQA